MFQIGLFSKLGKTTVKTLRYYERIGLLAPSYIDLDSGYRYYSTKELLKLHKIQSYKQMGLSLEEIGKLVEGENPDLLLKQKKDTLLKEQRILEDQIRRIGTFLKNQEEDLNMKYVAMIKEIPEVIVYRKKLEVPDYKGMFKVIPAVGKEVMELNPGLSCQVPEYCFNVYLDGEYKEKDIRFELCEAVTDFGVEGNGITFAKLPETTVAAVMHKGSYEALGEAYAYLYDWIEENGFKAVDNTRESFIDGIWNKESEEDWLTEVQVPVEKK